MTWSGAMPHAFNPKFKKAKAPSFHKLFLPAQSVVKNPRPEDVALLWP